MSGCATAHTPIVSQTTTKATKIQVFNERYVRVKSKINSNKNVATKRRATKSIKPTPPPIQHIHVVATRISLRAVRTVRTLQSGIRVLNSLRPLRLLSVQHTVLE